jgi:hypothetical protein
VAIHEIIGISLGKQTEVFAGAAAVNADEKNCFTLITPDIQLNLEVRIRGLHIIIDLICVLL